MLLVLLTLLIHITNVEAFQPETYIHVKKGETFSLAVSLSETYTNIEGFDIYLTFDEKVIDAKKVTMNENFVEAKYIRFSNLNNDNIVRSVIYPTKRMITAFGDVIYVEFETIGKYCSTILSISEFLCNNTQASGGFRINGDLYQTIKLIVDDCVVTIAPLPTPIDHGSIFTSMPSFLYGRISDASTGLPVSDATIIIKDINDQTEYPSFLSIESGNYGGSIQPGVHKIIVMHEKYESFFQAIQLESFRTSSLDIKLSPKEKSSISGHILNASTLLPIKDAAIQLNTGQTVLTDEEGLFSLSSISFSDYTLTVQANGFSSYSQIIEVDPYIPVEKNIVLCPQNKQKAIIVSSILNDYDYLNETFYELVEYSQVALKLKGFDDDDIYVLNQNSSIEQFKYAITDWAKDSSHLIIYMVGHGASGSFLINRNEKLDAENLNNWLNEIQSIITENVIIIYDSSFASSFIPTLSSNKYSRVVIASSSQNESSYFLSDGYISFSSSFWNSILLGKNLIESFFNATYIMNMFGQTPQVDANRNSIPNEHDDLKILESISLTKPNNFIPAIENISDTKIVKSEISSMITATVKEPEIIEKVWAIVIPPFYNTKQFFQELQKIELVDNNQDSIFECNIDKFNEEGKYDIYIFAEDINGYYSIPYETSIKRVSSKAIIVTGVKQFPDDNLWYEINLNANLAYSILKMKGYSDKSIMFLSPDLENDLIDDIAQLDSIKNTILNRANDTEDLIIYFVGHGLPAFFRVNSAETLSANLFYSWIDSLQKKMSGKLLFIYDGCASGSFVPDNISNQFKRIIITSTDDSQVANDSFNGNFSFSYNFWPHILLDTLLGAFDSAIGALEQNTTQTPQIDADGDFIWNEKDDYNNAEIVIGNHTISSKEKRSQTYSSLILSGETSAKIQINSSEIGFEIPSKVFALIIPPTNNAPSNQASGNQILVELNQNSNVYEADYHYFAAKGDYNVLFYSVDSNGAVNLIKTDTIVQKGASDMNIDENNNFPSPYFVLDNQQYHDFKDSMDEDWFMMYGVNETTYTVTATNTGIDCDVNIDLYNSFGQSVLTSSNVNGLNEDEFLSWNCPDNNIYFLKITNLNKDSMDSQNTYYTINAINSKRYDAYEEDNTRGQAKIINISSLEPQHHNFHNENDEDWVKFYGITDQHFSIRAYNLESRCDVVFDLYNDSGKRVISEPKDIRGFGIEEKFSWICPEDGIYYLKISNYKPLFGEKTGYDLKVYYPVTQVYPSFITGFVSDNSRPIHNALVKVNDDMPTMTNLAGAYYLPYHSGNQLVRVKKTGYQNLQREVYFEPIGNQVPESFEMQAVKRQQSYELMDAIILLQFFTGVQVNDLLTDLVMPNITEENKISIPNAIYILQMIANDINMK